jgi:Glycosyltransferase family 87
MKPTRLEFACLVAVLTFIGMMPLLSQYHATIYPIDYFDYLQAATGASYFYYPQWIVFILYPFTLIPLWFGFVLWSVLNIVCIYAACKLWRGNVSIALLSYPMLFMLFYGQITGILVLCLVLYDRWLGDKPLLAGFCAALALAKPQLAIPVLLYMALAQDISWYKRIVSLLPTALLFALSLLIYGDWVSVWLGHLQNAATQGSITLWSILGYWALLLWLPLGFIPPQKRLLFVICSSALALPYFQLTGLLLLLVLLPASAFSLLAFIGYSMMTIGWLGASLMLLLPLIIYLSIILYRG